VKKISAFVLLVIFLNNTIGYYLYFMLRFEQVKEEAIRKIRSNVVDGQTVRLSFLKNEKIDWRDGKKEISFKGNLYDVIRHYETEKHAVYICISDDAELELLKNHEETNPSKKNSSKLLLSYTAKDFSIDESSPFLNSQCTGTIKYFDELLYNFFSGGIIPPPPRS
jgi:hypothetical protein